MKRLLVTAVAVLSLSACSTLTRGTTQPFEVQTTPIGAEATLSTGLTCKQTPCTFPNINRNANFSVTVTKPGYKTVTTNITNKMGGGAALAGNIIFGGLIGAGVDASNGSLMDLTPNPLVLVLEPDTAPVAGTADPATTPSVAPAANTPAG